MNGNDDLVAALAPVAATFDELQIRFYIGGSVASSFHGAIRSTMDVDLVCDLREEQIGQLVTTLGGDYYVNSIAIREAVRRKSCFDLIHLATSYKVDLFVSRGRLFDKCSMDRAKLQKIGLSQVITVPVCTVEDSIISKLEWYRLTDETSERQWEDVSRLVKLMGHYLDLPYLEKMAASIRIDDLLEKLLRETLPPK